MRAPFIYSSCYFLTLFIIILSYLLSIFVVNNNNYSGLGMRIAPRGINPHFFDSKWDSSLFINQLMTSVPSFKKDLLISFVCFQLNYLSGFIMDILYFSYEYWILIIFQMNNLQNFLPLCRWSPFLFIVSSLYRTSSFDSWHSCVLFAFISLNFEESYWKLKSLLCWCHKVLPWCFLQIALLFQVLHLDLWAIWSLLFTEWEVDNLFLFPQWVPWTI